MNQSRIYNINEVISFSKTNEEFGGLSNMAPNYHIYINDIKILTSEALYQSCRFPNNPEIQQKIFEQFSPMYAKNISRDNTILTRTDWELIKIMAMRWAIRAKLACNFEIFSKLLFETKSYPIVEISRKDSFWGGIYYSKTKTIQGQNILGRLLMETREIIKNSSFDLLSPPPINNFLILKKEVPPIKVNKTLNNQITIQKNIF